jgi:hypothetical protein
MNVKTILEEQFKDLISEETLNSIEEAFQSAVSEKVDEKLKTETDKFNESFNEKLELEKENIKQTLDEQYTEKLQLVIEKIDADHTEKLQHVVEKIDADHTEKLKKLVEAIDTDHAVKLQKLVKNIDVKHTSMLKQVIEKYENELNNEATSFQERIVEEVSNYLDLYLDKNVPTEQISEAVSNVKAAKQLDEIRKIVGINEEFVDSEIKEALTDGKQTIDSLRAELNEAIKENTELNQKIKKAEAHILLEQKTSEMPSTKKTFINRLLKNKAPEYIEENFNYVVEMFDKETQNEVELVQESVKTNFDKTASIVVDRPQIVEEETNFNNEIERTPSGEGVSGYLNEMKKISGSRFTK